MGLSNVLNKPVLVKLAESTGDAADPIMVTQVLGSTASERLTYTLTVGAGVQNSSVLDLGANTVFGVAFPEALTSTTFAVQVSADGLTWFTVKKDDGTAYAPTCGASFYVPLTVANVMGPRYVRIVMGTAEAAARSLTAFVRPI